MEDSERGTGWTVVRKKKAKGCAMAAVEFVTIWSL